MTTQTKNKPKKAPTPAAPQILGRALLVNVRIGTWEARKLDASVTSTVHEKYEASSDAGRYHKRLFGRKAEEHSAILASAMAARQKHYAETLPWSDTGWRLLPSANYFTYTTAMRKAKLDFEIAVDQFIARYPSLVEAARETLHGMYRAEDYPPVETLLSRFSFTLEFNPLPAAEDFRVTLPQEEADRIARDVEERLTHGAHAAMKEAWARMEDVIQTLASKLTDGKYLRDSMIQRVGDVAESLGRLNLLQDPGLETIRKRALTELSHLQLADLKSSEASRSQAAAKAADILKAMQGFYTGEAS